MNKALLILSMFVALVLFSLPVCATCPCLNSFDFSPIILPKDTVNADLFKRAFINSDEWLRNLECYYCQMNFSESQKDQARRAVYQFLHDTKCLNTNGGCCESKFACRQYKKELKNLDCEMRKIINKCQKSDYRCIKNKVKAQVKCRHKCLVWPFSFCDGGCSGK